MPYGCYCGFIFVDKGGPVDGFGVGLVGVQEVLVSGLDDFSHELSCLGFDVMPEVFLPADTFVQCGRCHVLWVFHGGQLVHWYPCSACHLSQVRLGRWAAVVLLSVVEDVVV